jgi:hypothetical protein
MFQVSGERFLVCRLAQINRRDVDYSVRFYHKERIMRRFRIVITATVFSLLLPAIFAIAPQTAFASLATFTYWQQDPLTPGDWHDPLNWDNGIPGIDHWGYILNGGTVQIFNNVNCSFLDIRTIESATVDHFAGEVSLDQIFTIGTYNMSEGAVLLVDYKSRIGSTGLGVFNQSGGLHDVYGSEAGGYFEVGGWGGTGAYNLNQGELRAKIETIGNESSTGVFNQTGGIHTVSLWLSLGKDGSEGTYNMAGGILSVGSNEYIGGYVSYGYYGWGEFNQTGGTHTVNGFLYLGRWGSGTYNLSGGSLEASDLAINYGWMDVDVSEIDLFAVSSDRVSLLDGYIGEDKIIDSTLSPGQYLYAFYDSENDWTTLDVGFIPEPSTLLLLAPGLLGFAGLLRRRLR